MMRCDWVQSRLDSYHDNELEHDEMQSIMEHLDECSACHSEYFALQEMTERISVTGRYTLPSNLMQNLEHKLDNESMRTGSSLEGVWRFRQLGYGLAAGLFLGILSHVAFDAQSDQNEVLTHWLVSAHVDSQLADHFIDISSSDNHQVKPWFNGRVNYAVPVRNLATEGFDLLGGRVDYNGTITVAALGYRYRQHDINLFIWPNQEALPAKFHQSRHHGYNLVGWKQAGLWYLAVSDLNLNDLGRLKGLYLNQ